MKTKLCVFILFIAAAFTHAQSNINIGGTVVDDETGNPLVDFEVQTGMVWPSQTGETSWQVYTVGNPKTPGQFYTELQLRPWPERQVRILAPGYESQILTKQSLTNAQENNLDIRLKHASTFQGVVLDDDGRPAAGARVLLITTHRAFLMDGKFQYGEFKGSSTNTDDAGRFTLQGSGGIQKVVIVSVDGHLIQPAVQSVQGQDMKITLPKPGTLVVRYDIPGDMPEAKPEIRLMRTNTDMVLWQDVGFGLSFTVTNGGEITLTNLTPGTYYLGRWKSDGTQGAQTERETVVVEAGQTQHLGMIRTNGQRIRGKIVGPDSAMASGGYVFIRSAEATGQPWPQRSRNEQKEYTFPTFDVTKFDADGTFQTAMLKPGSYTVVASVYPPKPSSQWTPHRNNNPDYVGVAKITVTADAMPSLTIKLAPALFTDIAGRVTSDKGFPIRDAMIQSGKVNPARPGEIIWNEGYQGTYQDGGFTLWGWKEGTAIRFLANGYLPKVFTREEIIASRQTADLQVRMDRGVELHGVVLDHAGSPVARAKVYLAPLDLGFVRFGSSGSSGNVTYWSHTVTTTDAAGHFSLRGVGDKPRLIVVTADGQMVQPLQVSGSGEDVKITLSEPATLIVNYDIPGDVATADFNLTLHTNELKRPLWNYITLKPTARVTNGEQTVLNNLMPGTYDFSRTKIGGKPGRGYAFLFGDPYNFVQFDTRTLVLKPGQTQHVNIVRSTGQRVQGQVTGLESITNAFASYIYVGSATAIKDPQDFGAQLEPCYDGVLLDTNGVFQTALLEPGDYTLVAEAYAWGARPKREFRDDEPQYGDSFFTPQQLAYVGSAKVTVTADAVPPPVKIELRPWVAPAKTP